MILVLRFSLGLMFGLSASSKLMSPRSFFYGVAEYGLLPQRMVVISALGIIVCETFLAVSHVSGQFLVFSVPMALIILFVFFTAIGINLVRQRDIPCFCFGNGEGESISARSLARLIIAIAGEF